MLIAIAGCGIAGLASALLLTRDGHRVVLIERFETPRPLGSGLIIQPTGLAVLKQLGLDAATIAAGSRIDRLFGKAIPSGKTVLDVRYAALKGEHCGIGIHRASLFGFLYEAVRDAGITIETGRTVVGAPMQDDGRRRVLFSDGCSDGPFDLVIDTLGTSSPLAPPTGRELAYGALWASLPWPTHGGFDSHALEQRYVRASKMTGVLPIGTPPGASQPQAAFFWSLRADRLTAWRAEGLESWKEDVQRLWPETSTLLETITTPEQLTFARYAHRTLAQPVADRLVHIGDAWHSTSPQLGQGANMALLDACALATALRLHKNVNEATAEAIALRHRHVQIYQAMSVLFTPVYQSDSATLPFLRDWVAGPLSRLWPAPALLAMIVTGLIGAPLRSLNLQASRAELSLSSSSSTRPAGMA
ncbi:MULTISPECIES: NAD(P)/FAD-dependent oxidoreductase [unclassified Beijerinckia]|uniref:FAD-dependent oxidoreductase n=1 Tax=unclassified Beijerinckia TaxID=2638183 RepID=UPI00089AA453|nr:MULTISPECIES: NAD(P)/FAD-dependent oxidoreductase [unclassified Beijerinckia]MDH7796169.1 salicylate hydroxylase [Beijerinckia sp. GAS462]SEC33362.1 2-polyprenyl-6-methoxyphenol hydroxylase [Beijerinckia sp. 28-YEA-48]